MSLNYNKFILASALVLCLALGQTAYADPINSLVGLAGQQAGQTIPTWRSLLAAQWNATSVGLSGTPYTILNKLYYCDALTSCASLVHTGAPLTNVDTADPSTTRAPASMSLAYAANNGATAWVRLRASSGGDSTITNNALQVRGYGHLGHAFRQGRIDAYAGNNNDGMLQVLTGVRTSSIGAEPVWGPLYPTYPTACDGCPLSPTMYWTGAAWERWDRAVLSNGIRAHSQAYLDNPTALAAYAEADASALDSSGVIEGDVSRLKADIEGRQLIRTDHPNRVDCFIDASTATTLTLITGCGAPGAGLSIYLTDISFGSSAAGGTAADASPTLKFGTGGACGTGTTSFWSAAISANTTVFQPLQTPRKITANNEVCFIMSTAGTKWVKLSGYIAP